MSNFKESPLTPAVPNDLNESTRIVNHQENLDTKLGQTIARQQDWDYLVEVFRYGLQEGIAAFVVDGREHDLVLEWHKLLALVAVWRNLAQAGWLEASLLTRISDVFRRRGRKRAPTVNNFIYSLQASLPTWLQDKSKVAASLMNKFLSLNNEADIVRPPDLRSLLSLQKGTVVVVADDQGSLHRLRLAGQASDDVVDADELIDSTSQAVNGLFKNHDRLTSVKIDVQAGEIQFHVSSVSNRWFTKLYARKIVNFGVSSPSS